MDQSEIEDLYEVTFYQDLIYNTYGVPLQSPKFKGQAKWSVRMRETFKAHGKPWSDKIEMEVKGVVAALVEAQPGPALNEHKRSSFDALVSSLEGKITTIAVTCRPSSDQALLGNGSVRAWL